MDPRPNPSPSPLAGIPRTRGDGPVAAQVGSVRFTDSPHPRGWTHVLALDLGHRAGFPAPAGMDPGCPAGRPPPSRIPRTRGDGPGPTGTIPPERADSPHPRGWTPSASPPRTSATGFPAPAGMDLDNDERIVIYARIPRTRGDGPSSSDKSPPATWDSPHPRGWTLRRRAGDGRRRGFPAPAGMDRRGGSDGDQRDGIPRTRGDGPWTRAVAGSKLTDSPHPRGWTLIRSVKWDETPGFPAPAGMDPSGSGLGARRRWIPRTRGDGPWMVAPGALRNLDSPHPRGWTRQPQRRQRRRRGFPAPAGMDRRRPGRCATPGWIPRTRGDGPD